MKLAYKMPSSSYTIHPILCGTIEGAEWGNLTLKHHMGEKVRVPSIMWLVRSNRSTVVVDTGPGDPAAVKAITGRDIAQHENPAAKLKKLGVDPATVSMLVLSHLHWDHSGGLDLFPNATIYVHRAELHWAIAPLPIQEKSYELGRLDNALPRWLASRRRMKVVDEDIEIAPGLNLVHLPGHTPGCMGLCCRTAGGDHLIACDAVPTFENLEKNIPPGWYVNLADAYRSLRRARAIANVVLPGHDMRVLDAEVYPR